MIRPDYLLVTVFTSENTTLPVHLSLDPKREIVVGACGEHGITAHSQAAMEDALWMHPLRPMTFLFSSDKSLNKCASKHNVHEKNKEADHHVLP